MSVRTLSLFLLVSIVCLFFARKVKLLEELAQNQQEKTRLDFLIQCLSSPKNDVLNNETTYCPSSIEYNILEDNTSIPLPFLSSRSVEKQI